MRGCTPRDAWVEAFGGVESPGGSAASYSLSGATHESRFHKPDFSYWHIGPRRSPDPGGNPGFNIFGHERSSLRGTRIYHSGGGHDCDEQPARGSRRQIASTHTCGWPRVGACRDSARDPIPPRCSFTLVADISDPPVPRLHQRRGSAGTAGGDTRSCSSWASWQSQCNGCGYYDACRSPRLRIVT